MNPYPAFRYLFWILLAGVLLMRLFFGIQVRRRGERLLPDQQAVAREGRSLFLARVVLFFLLIAWLALYAVNPSWLQILSFDLPAWLRWTGFGVGLLSLGLWTWSQAALGSLWSAQLQLRREHHLVTTGPYARIRHPLYTAMFGMALAFALTTANWVFAFFGLIVVLGTTGRVSREEQMMLEQFGDEYRAYMARTGRLLPTFIKPEVK